MQQIICEELNLLLKLAFPLLDVSWITIDT